MHYRTIKSLSVRTQVCLKVTHFCQDDVGRPEHPSGHWDTDILAARLVARESVTTYI